MKQLIKKVECICQKCGQKFYRYPSQYVPGRTKYCSITCRQSVTMTRLNKEQFSGENHPRYNGHIKNQSDGYKHLWIAPGKYRNESILIAEKVLGRSLKSNECVHHINGNKKDNRNENLLVCTKSYHSWLHAKMRELENKHNNRPYPSNSGKAKSFGYANPEPSLLQEGVETRRGASLMDEGIVQTTNELVGSESYS